MFSETPEQSDQYAALTDRVGWLALPSWTQIEISGTDRVTFLNGMCTNDMRLLTAGQGSEAFATTSDGKTLGHFFVFAGEQQYEIIGAPGQADTLLKHWDRYIIREDVRLRDVSGEQALLLVAGQQATAKLAALLGSETPADLLGHVTLLFEGMAIRVHRMEITPPAYFITTAAADAQQLGQRFTASGMMLCNEQAWETFRLELGWPLFGRDITSKNLPQEVNRDRRAISFQKGCYIGQETVARIDALGHVNWKLAGLRLPPLASWTAGSEIQVDGKVAARITSTAFSPQLRAPMALAYVRRGYSEPGQRLGAPGNEAEVVELPLRRSGDAADG